MTIRELFDYAVMVKPHVFSDEVQLLWLNELEGRIQLDIFLLATEEVKNYSLPEDENTELLVDLPHTGIYRYWMEAMVDLENGEYSKYQNDMEVFNNAWNEFACWFAETQGTEGDGVRYGFYLSAYGIAVKHGYTGSEEEWLESLRGKKGDPFTYEDFTEEQLADLRAGVVQETLDAASASAQEAGTHAEAAKEAAKNAESARDAANQAATAAEQAAQLAAQQAAAEIEQQLAGYVTDAESAKDAAKSAAGSAAQDAVAAVDTELAGYVAAAQLAQKAAEQARDEAQEVAGGNFATPVYVDEKAKTAEDNAKAYVDEKLQDIDVDVTADEVTFADGETFQQKYDSGELTGPVGEPGQPGGKGEPGAPAKINGVNVLTIEVDENLTIEQNGSVLKIGLGKVPENSNSTVVALLASNWVEDNGEYSQTVAVPFMTVDAKVVNVDVQKTGTDKAADAEAEAGWVFISGATDPVQLDGAVKFYAYEIPTVNVPVKVGVA